MRHETDVDVVIVGGGAAGLAAALMLGRARRSVVVVDDGRPRNAPAEHVHGYLGREGVAPAELLAIGRDEVAAYGVEVRPGRVVRLERRRRRSVRRRARRRCHGQLPPGARRHRAPRRVATDPRHRRAVGSRRPPLPVLPRLGGSRPADRRRVDQRVGRVPGVAVAAVVRRRHARRAQRTGSDRPRSASSSAFGASRSSKQPSPASSSPTIGWKASVSMTAPSCPPRRSSSRHG